MNLSYDHLNAAVALLLGRTPSQAAYTQFKGKAAGSIIEGIVLGEEFSRLVNQLLLGGEPLPHERQPFALSAEQVAWLEEYFPASEAAVRRSLVAAGWKPFLAILILDEELARFLSGTHNKVKLQRFLKLKEAVAKHDFTAPQPQPEKKKPAKVIGSIGNAVKTEDLVNQGSLTRHEVKLVLDKLRFDKDFKRVRNRLSRLSSAGDRRQLIPLYKMMLECPSCTDFFRAQTAYYAARAYFAMNASETAYRICRDLRTRMDTIEGFDADDKLKVKKFYLQALQRIGRREEYLAEMEIMQVEHPGEWDWYFQLGLFYSATDPEQADHYFHIVQRLNPNPSIKQRSYLGEFYLQASRMKEAHALFASCFNKADDPDAYIMLANYALATGKSVQWSAYLKRFFTAQGLHPCCIDASQEPGFTAVEPGGYEVTYEHPLVTIAMTTFNSAETVTTAVKSVLEQTCQNFELFIIDDCSSDNTQDILAALARKDERITVILNERNVGTYYSKNQAILHARGQYVTFHDSDDWMHPQRIEKHLEAMREGIAMSTSKWIRMDTNGVSIIRRGGGYTHDNPASTFIRKEVFEELGLFDTVRTGADSEMRWRIINAYGKDVIEDLNYALAIGLHHEKSLTMAGVAAFDEHRFSQVRLDYWEAWVNWQIDLFAREQPMYMPFPHEPRMFAAPESILAIQ